VKIPSYIVELGGKVSFIRLDDEVDGDWLEDRFSLFCFSSSIIFCLQPLVVFCKLASLQRGAVAGVACDEVIFVNRDTVRGTIGLTLKTPFSSAGPAMLRLASCRRLQAAEGRK